MNPEQTVTDPVERFTAFLAKKKAEFDAMTPEQKAEVRNREIEREKSDRRSKVELLRYEWNAPLRHLKRNPDAHPEWVKKHDIIKALIEHGGGVMIALVGNRGNGKTQIAVEMMKHRTDSLRSAYFTTATEFFIKIKSTYDRDSKTDEQTLIDRFSHYSLLVVDEVGKRGGSEWENNLLFEMLNRRYNHMKDTILIDNRSKDEFIETIGPSLASRMNEGGGIIECNWESFR